MECYDCGAPGVRCATPEGEILDGDRLVPAPIPAGHEILCASAHGLAHAVCASCEARRDALAVSASVRVSAALRALARARDRIDDRDIAPTLRAIHAAEQELRILRESLP